MCDGPPRWLQLACNSPEHPLALLDTHISLPPTPFSLLASTAACLQRLLLVCGLAGVQVAPVGHAVVHLREA